MLDRTLVVIPARGGSKSIPWKQLSQLGGRTITGHSIRHAKIAGFKDEQIIVSSQSPEILKETEYNGGTPLLRPEEISGPLSRTEETMRHALNCFPYYEYVMVLQPTSPIRKRGRIQEVLDKAAEFDSVSTVTRLFPFFFHQTSEGFKRNDWLKARPMKQMIPAESYYHFDCGNIYLTKVSVLFDKDDRISDHHGVVEISLMESMQIDSTEELEMLQIVFGKGIENFTGVPNSV